MAVVSVFLSVSVRAQLPGTPDPTFAPTVRSDGTVVVIATQLDGKQIIAGNFYRVGNVVAPSLARLNADGSLDTSFMPPTGLGSIGYVAVAPNGKIVLVELNDDNYPPTYEVLRLNADGSADTSFTPPSFNGQFGSGELYPFIVAIQADSKVLVSGAFIFDPSSGMETNTLIRFNADGSRDTGFQAVGISSGTVPNSLLPLANGQVLVAGASYFANTPNFFFTGILRLNADGSLDKTYNPVTRDAYALALQPDGKLLYLEAEGSASYAGGVPRRLNADGSADTSFMPQFSNAPCFDSLVLQPDGKVVVGGYIATGAPQLFIPRQSGVARVNADGTVDATFQPVTTPQTTDSIYALALQSNGQVLVGGTFTNLGGVTRASLGRLNTNGTVDNNYATDLTNVGEAYAVTAQAGGKPLVLDTGSLINGVAASFLSSFNTNGSLNVAFPLPGAPRIPFGNGLASPLPDSAIAQQADGKILVLGEFDYPFIYPVLERFNADGTPDAGFSVQDPFGTNQVILPQPDGRILLAGNIGFVNPHPYPVRRLNADGSSDSSFVPGPDPANNPFSVTTTFYALALQPDGRILSGGAPAPVNGQPGPGVIRFNADGSVDTSFNAGAEQSGGYVLALAVQPDGKVLVGGLFTAIGGVPCGNVARLNADGSLDASFGTIGAGANGTVRSIVLQADGKIIVGGAFSTLNGVAAAGVVRLTTNGSVDPQFMPGTGTGGTGVVDSVALAPDGSIIVGGSFKQFNGQARDGVARLFGGNVPTPVITSSTTITANINQAFSYQIVASGTPTSYGAMGLPAGLTLAANTGLISGTPTVAGTFTVALSATNLGGPGTASLNLVVFDVPVVSFVVPGSADGKNTTIAEGGPKLKIQVTRTGGDPTRDLTVRYKTGGDSVADVDYKALSDVVVIPAGADSALIKVKAYDDGVADGTKKLKIKLLPDAASAYTLGAAPEAKITILDAESGQ